MATRVGLLSLGCPKNQVNAERMLAALQEAGMELTENIYADGADAVIVNTCGFIDDAKREAVECILEMAELKEEGLVRRILVTGCLAESYREQIKREIPEVDAVLGLGANEDIAHYVFEALAGEQKETWPELGCLPLGGPRRLLSPAHWAYLMLADGCDNRCAYCKIPDIRGPFRSRPEEDILEEARQLAGRGVKELVLIAQDTTRYGLDLYGARTLPGLLRKLCRIDGIAWLRLLYCYPDEVTDELIQVMAEEPNIVKYIDLPLQHIDDRILRAMGRRGTQAQIRELLQKLRGQIPGIAIRTTFLVGFPGEDEQAFEALSAFVEEQRFERMGVFAFSPQEGTPAYGMPGQVDPEVASRRAEILNQQQAEIADRLKAEAVGGVLPAIIEDYDGYTDSYMGRTALDAPEIDGGIILISPRDLENGDIVNVRVAGVREDDLLGRVLP
ncbi:MAG: 30S ribosomal protein S12 methylthiotransferase RimO [Oscillospiraceae bacterium]|jgi:ribosomal protein S12 methylthiotransferase|nr:30S ribosomal protein S12 methylthiotransferase RimO [Oscillospiraceae bacterium]